MVENWTFPRPFGARTVIIVLIAFLVLAFTGQRIEIGKIFSLSAEQTETSSGLVPLLGKLVPIQLSDQQDIRRIADFDPQNLPPFARIETVETVHEELNPVTLQSEKRQEQVSYLVRPFGYLGHVTLKMIESLEIALWATFLAILAGLPLSLLAASNMMPVRAVRAGADAIIAVLRAVPELISALFLVVAFGFGPVAGVLALMLHSAGFFGKFFAQDMENADPRPQEALQAIGVGRLGIWRLAILPQVLPHHIGYILYILDRNMRMSTVIGIVGAGGIGQELKGRFDMYEYSHVGTMLLAIFIVVISLDYLSTKLRRAIL